MTAVPPRTVRLVGAAVTLRRMPPTPPGVELWCANSTKVIIWRQPRILKTHEWTRWFNLHSRAHMDTTYPDVVAWHKRQDGTCPLYMQRAWPDLPGSVAFPRAAVQQYFRTDCGPNRYFTCSVAWMIALAVMEGFHRLEFWGFSLSDQKPSGAYAYERPCYFYWTGEARRRGIDVIEQEEVEAIPHIEGNPDRYVGPLYGYGTRPEAL